MMSNVLPRFFRSTVYKEREGDRDAGANEWSVVWEHMMMMMMTLHA